MKKPVYYCLLLLLLCSNTLLLIAQDEQPYILKPVGDEAYEAILQFYQYDRDIPLEVQIVETVDNENFIREKIVFRGVMDSRVVGYLARPIIGEPPYPCVLQMHGMTLSKSDYWHDFYDPFELITRDYHHGELVTESLLSSGYAVLALDMPYHGERSYENNFETTYNTFFNKGWGYRLRDMLVQSTLEYRRALDYLETRKEIDSERIGAIGYSLGSVVTFILTAIDERVKTTVICSTAFIKPRPFLPPEEYLSGFAPQTFIRSMNGRPILMLQPENDTFNCTEAEAKQLYDLIEGDHKELIFYHSGHALPAEHAPVAVDWFLKYLK